jgi:hypothetical protein
VAITNETKVITHTSRSVDKVVAIGVPPRAAGSQGSQNEYFKQKIQFSPLNTVQIKHAITRAFSMQL